MGAIGLRFRQRNQTRAWRQSGDVLPVLNAFEVGAFEDDVHKATRRWIRAVQSRTDGVSVAGFSIVFDLSGEVPSITRLPIGGVAVDHGHVGPRDDPNVLDDGAALQQGVAAKGEGQRELPERVVGADVEGHLEQAVGVGEVHTCSAVAGPRPVHRHVGDGPEGVVHELGLDGGRRVAVKARHRGGQEVGRTDDGDVDVRARLGQGGRITGVVVRRVREVHTHAVGARAVLAEPRPVVRVTGLAVADGRPAREGRLLSAEELSVVVDVDLQGHRICVPRNVGPV